MIKPFATKAQGSRRTTKLIFRTMTTIELRTVINAPINICFDLARSIDLHQLTTQDSNEKAIAGRTSGLIGKGEQVTWQATHFMVRQTLTSEIADMQAPYYFFDRMTAGAFKSLEHAHTFREENGKTLMSDLFHYEVPFGWAGRLFNRLILKKYLKRLLQHRNGMIKQVAESGEWRRFIGSSSTNA
jgi:ligand-binding SRPBCC domain-containing protein